MSRQTYTASNRSYDTTGNVYAPGASRVYIDTFERGELDYRSLYAEEGEITSLAAYSEQRGYRGGMPYTTEVWRIPGDAPADPTRETLPGPGDEFCFVTRLVEFQNQWQTWYAWGGRSDRYPRYQAEFISDGGFRVTVRTEDSGRYTIASDPNNPVSWNTYLGEWLVLAIRWKHPDEGDTEHGVRALLTEASDFPFHQFSFEGYDAGDFTLSPIDEIESPYSGNPTGEDDIPQDEGRIGFRGTGNVRYDVDAIELLSATPPTEEPTGGTETVDRGSTIETPNDNDLGSGIDNQSGVLLETNRNLTGFEITISANTEGLTRAYLKEPAGGAILQEKDISGLGPGDTFTIETPLSGGEQYDLVGDAQGSTYQRGRYDSTGQYPYESTDFDIVNGVYSAGGATASRYRYNFYRVTALR